MAKVSWASVFIALSFLVQSESALANSTRARAALKVASILKYIRAATANQLQIGDSEMQKLKKSVEAFDPKQPMNDTIRKYLESNGLDAVQRSGDLAAVMNLLDETGLREKLATFAGQHSQKRGSLWWWMKREPLRHSSDPKLVRKTLPLGSTAKELGLKFVVFSTREASIHSSLHNPEFANVLISREALQPEEIAPFGDGFYTIGIRTFEDLNRVYEKFPNDHFHTTIYALDPSAQEGLNFSVHVLDDYHYVVNHNRDMLRPLTAVERCTLALTLK
jgi:hypothetical protein